MRKFAHVLFAVITAVVSMPAFAMDLSLDTAVSKILAESQDMKKADANIKKAKASLDAANSNRWMQIEGTASYMNMVDVEHPFSGSMNVTLPPQLGGLVAGMMGSSTPITEIEMPDNIFMAGVTITQPIYTFGKIGNAVESVRSAIKMSETSKEMVRREVKYSAVDLYWTAKMTDEIVKLAEKDLKSARDARRNLTSAGRASRGNLVKIESDVATKEINLSDAKFNRDTAHRMLKILAGIDVDEELNLTTEFPNDFSDLNAGKLKNTPEWDLLNQQIRMYEKSARSKRAGGRPTLAAMASYDYVSIANSADALFDKKGEQSAYWGLALQMPIFSGGVNRANATVEAMNAEAARQDLDKSRKVTTEKYNTAIAQYNHLRGNLATLKNARDLAARAYDFSRQRFIAGQTSAIELAEASSGLYQLDMALLNSKYKILMAAESVKKLGE
ncbi:MAG: TolC family protein [Alphaproteobacteria bacterium]|nr:TolC family protein [Alphaproteobacteria bacterium]